VKKAIKFNAKIEEEIVSPTKVLKSARTMNMNTLSIVDKYLDDLFENTR
jgi:hypothetical protein